MTATRYDQMLDVLIDQPEALEHDPLLVKRLRRLCHQRRANVVRSPLTGCDAGASCAAAQL